MITKSDKRLAQIKLFQPPTWPPFVYILAFSLVAPLFLHLYAPNVFRFGSDASSLLISTCVAALIAKTFGVVQERRLEVKRLEANNVPCVPNVNPFTGNYFECIHRPYNLLKKLDDLHYELGKTFAFFYGPDLWIMTIDNELLQKVFVEMGHKYVDIGQLQWPYMSEIGRSLAQVQGDTWRQLRKVLNPSFSMHQMKSDNAFDDIKAASNKFVEYLENYPLEPERLDGGPRGKIIDTLYDFKRFTIEVVARVAMGRENCMKFDHNQHEPLIEAVTEAAKMAMNPAVLVGIFFHNLQRFIGFVGKAFPFAKYIKRIHDYLTESMEIRRKLKQENKISGKHRKMIDTIVESFDRNKLDDETAKANLFFLFIAGFETSSTSLSILCWFLARHPQVQEKLRRSILEHGEESKYLEACINEALRLYPPVPTAISRIITDDIEHKGMVLTAGSTIQANIWSIHRWPEYWGDDVLEFKPERWLERKILPGQFQAFGSGPRNCLGMRLAMVELKSLTSRLLLMYRLEKCATTPEVLDITAPNIIHVIFQHPIEVRFVRLDSVAQ